MRGRLLHSCRSFLTLASLVVAARAGAQSPNLPNCGAAGCVPAVWGPGQTAAGYGLGAPDFFPGQTFEPKFTGVLSSVRVGLLNDNPGIASLQIRTTSGGLPTNTVLGSAPVPGAPYAAGVLYSASFAGQNIVLTAGTRYAIVFAGAPPHVYVLASFPACSAVASGAQDYVHTYDNGATWQKLQIRDRTIIFEVCSDAATATSTTTWGRVKAIYR